MSYILDALRKSETERQQGRMPDLAQSIQMVHKPSRKRIPLAAWVAVGFFVNALVLVVIFWPGTGFMATAVDAKAESNGSADPSESSSTQLTRSDTTSPVARTATDRRKEQGISEPKTADRPDKQAGKVPQPGTASSNNGDEAVAPVSGQAAIARQASQPSSETANAAQEPDNVGVDYVAGGNQQERQATLIVPDRSRRQIATFADAPPGALPPKTAEHLMEKSLAYQRSIPTLHFSSHIYASDPGARRVTINGHYLRVGDSFQGIRVEAINPDGVILSAYGDSFRVGVVSDWVSPR